MKKFNFYFFLLSLVLLFGYAKNEETIKFIFKPFIMLSLIAFICYQIKGNNKDYFISIRLISTGFFFSFLGDIFLLGTSNNSFLYGMIAFFLTHVCYAYAFLSPALTNENFKFSIRETIVLFLFLSYGLLMFYKLFPLLANFKIPVFFYMSALLFMSYSSFLFLSSYKNCDNKNIKKASICFFTSSLFFVASDTLLAFVTFSEKFPIPYKETLVILTYIVAQFLMMKGAFFTEDND